MFAAERDLGLVLDMLGRHRVEGPQSPDHLVAAFAELREDRILRAPEAGGAGRYRTAAFEADRDGGTGDAVEKGLDRLAEGLMKGPEGCGLLAINA